MAQLKDLLVSGAARFINGIFVNGTSVMNDINPAATDTYSLGTSTYKWKNIYSKGVNIGADGISINGNISVSGAHDIGSSSNKWNNIYSDTFTGYLDGNAASATKANRANITTTTNAIAKYSDTKGTFANTGITIDGSNNITTPGNIYFTGTPVICWNDGTYRQRIAITDDSTVNTAVFSFQQSTNTGTSYGDLLVIRDNGDLYPTGSIKNLPVGGGVYWNPYVESASDASDAASITLLNSGAAGGTELRVSVANDAADILNFVAPYYIYFNSKKAFQINDGWLRINPGAGFTGGTYFDSKVRVDGETQVRTLNHINGNIAVDGSWITGTSGAAGTATDGDANYNKGICGTNILSLGNGTSYTSATNSAANNSKGYFRIYGAGSGYGQLTYNDSMFDSNKSILLSSTADSGISNEIRGRMATNDYWRIAGGATAQNAGYLEISTADDTNEPIYVRQYSGAFSTVNTTLTLLDAYHNTYIPYTLYINSNPSGYSTTATYGVGARVYYLGKIYRCTTAITTAEAWTAGHWEEQAFKLYVNGMSYFGNAVYLAGSTYIGANGAGGYINGASATNGGCNSIRIGDDVWIGDVNVGGMMGMQPYSSSTTSCGLVLRNGAGTEIGRFYADGTNIVSTKHIVPSTTNSLTLGTTSLRWSKLYIGTADSYGGTSKPIYWKDGVPTALSDTIGSTIKPVYMNAGTITACTYSLSATVNAGTANQLAYYSGANAVSGASSFTINNTNGMLTVVGKTGVAKGVAVALGTTQKMYVGIGSGDVNHGIYSNVLGKWMVYADASNIYLNGYCLKATLNNATQWGVAYYSTTTNVTSTAAGTAGYLLQGNGSAAPSWIQATNSNTGSTIVKRDSNGDFSARIISAKLTGGAGGAWISARDNATIRNAANTGGNTGSYYPMASGLSATGNWSIGTLNDNFYFAFSTNANYTAGTNTASAYYITSAGVFSGAASKIRVLSSDPSSPAVGEIWVIP